jgi:hypothetical protein
MMSVESGQPKSGPVLASGVAAALRADAEAAQSIDPRHPESVEARRARVHAALGQASVDARGLSRNHVMRFLVAGWREEYDHTGRRIALHPPVPSVPPPGVAPTTSAASAPTPDMAATTTIATPGIPLRLPPPPPPPSRRPYRGPCLAPGCGREVRRIGDLFCGSPECREWQVQRNRGRARQRAYDLYHRDPKAANQLRIAQRRRKRRCDRIASKTLSRHCAWANCRFEVTDGRSHYCSPEHAKAGYRELNRLAAARYRARHAPPRRSYHRAKRYVPRAHYILTELMA